MSFSSQRLFRTDSVRVFREASRVQPAAIRLKRLREGATPALSVRKLAAAVGMAASTYAFYEDHNKFKKPYLPVELAKELVKPFSEHGVEMWDVLALAGLEEQSSGSDRALESEMMERLDLVPIASINFAYGMGGTFADVAIEESSMRFPRLWLEAITSTPAPSLTWARGRGDSMAPTISDGDILLIDRSQRRVDEQDLIWALTVGDIGMVKRLRVRGARVAILSDNERVPSEEVFHEEINLIGRIVSVVKRI